MRAAFMSERKENSLVLQRDTIGPRRVRIWGYNGLPRVDLPLLEPYDAYDILIISLLSQSQERNDRIAARRQPAS